MISLKTKIVILGAGYGGLMTTVRLQKKIRTDEAEIVLINKNNYHYETTWLHEAAAGTLRDDQVTYPVKSVIDVKKVAFIQASVTKIATAEKKVMTDIGEVSYDYLVIALGGESETFGIKGLKEYAYSITSVDAAKRIREHIESQFSTYQNEVQKKEERLTIVVGGAGFTGIEFLGELVNRIPQLCKTYEIDQNKVKIYCVEAAKAVLPGFDPELVEYAVAHLEKRGVQFKIGTPIKGADSEGILVGIGEEETQEIKAGTIIWAAGIRGSSVIGDSGFESNRCRIKVDPDLRAPGHENIFIIGDCSLIINEEINRPYPPTAQIALQQADVVTNNLLALLRHETNLTSFKPDIKGTVCSLGERDAIGIVFGKKLKGKPASVMKKVIDNRALFSIGGTSTVLKKGKFNIL